MVRNHGSLVHDEELNDAAKAAARGAAVGAAKWGIFSALGAAAAWRFSPMYRSLTFQFKVFLQMSGMALGSMIEADQRLRAHEKSVRRHKQLARDSAMWQTYQQQYFLSQETEHDAERAQSRSEQGSK